MGIQTTSSPLTTSTGATTSTRGTTSTRAATSTRGTTPTRGTAAAVPAVAAEQGGVFTAEQARAEGWTARTVRRRIATRRWVYVAGRALAARTPGEPAAEWTAFQLAQAAQLSLREGVISHRTAAGLHGFPVPDPDDDTVPECHLITRSRRPAGHRIRPHRVRLTADEVETGPGELWVTTATRTALDCLASFPLGAALDLWAWLTTRQILDREQLLTAISDRQNWHGTAQLKRIADLGSEGAVSEAEIRMQRLLRRARLTGWTANAPVHDQQGLIGIVDLLFEQARVVVEVDGWKAHKSHAAFVADRRRGNRLAAAGYRVLHVTWPDLTDRPDEVIAELRQVLAQPGLAV